jgi:hypothetical protein
LASSLRLSRKFTLISIEYVHSRAQPIGLLV